MIKLVCDSCGVDLPLPVECVGTADDDRGLPTFVVLSKPKDVPWLLGRHDGVLIFTCSPDCAMAYDKDHGIKTQGIYLGD